MKPMFPFFGSKARIAKRYGPPRLPQVIEPFAGSASYSVYWEPKHVLLIDRDPVIIETWRYLIAATPADIMRLPVDFTTTDDLDLPPGAKHLIGFWLNKASTHPNKKQGRWSTQYRADGQCRVWSESAKERLAAQVPKIKHWLVECADYTQTPDVTAHWFIDPPYTSMGHRYRCRLSNYHSLSMWCQRRRGFVQVCENNGASWLPFKPFAQVRGLNQQSTEFLYEFSA